MNITERCESFVWDVKNYFHDSFSNFPMLKRYEQALVGLGTFQLSKLRIPKFT